MYLYLSCWWFWPAGTRVMWGSVSGRARLMARWAAMRREGSELYVLAEGWLSGSWRTSACSDMHMNHEPQTETFNVHTLSKRKCVCVPEQAEGHHSGWFRSRCRLGVCNRCGGCGNRCGCCGGVLQRGAHEGGAAGGWWGGGDRSLKLLVSL